MGTSTNIQVNTIVASGTITRVDYYNDWTLIGSSTVAPFTFAWSPSTYGPFHLYAVATDSAGRASVRSSAINVQVPYDSDGNGWPTGGRSNIFGHTGAVTGYSQSSDPDGNGYTLAQDFAEGSDPTNYYSQNGHIVTPTETIVSGNNQSGQASAILPNPLVVKVTE